MHCLELSESSLQLYIVLKDKCQLSLMCNSFLMLAIDYKSQAPGYKKISRRQSFEEKGTSFAPTPF